MEVVIQQVIQSLQNKGVILYPTDTIWGIGCDATETKAVEKINLLKNRMPKKSYIILVSDKSMLEKYVGTIPPKTWEIINRHKQPTTIIFDKINGLSPNILASDGSLGVRIVTEGFAHSLIYNFGKPLVATSANISGEENATNFSEINQKIKDDVNFIVPQKYDKGTKTPSAIIRFDDENTPIIIRK